MVTATANNNKYYKQIPHGSTWTAEYGRVGNPPQTKEYPMSSWESKYHEKLNKGYTDQTELTGDLVINQIKATSQYLDISNQDVAQIVDRLQAMAKQAISDNYTVATNKVTQAMIDEAQNVLVSLLQAQDCEQFNNILLKLFVTIPRKMGNVSSYLAHDIKDFSNIIQTEQDLLDVMKGQVVQRQVESTNDSNDINNVNKQTILDAMGLVIESCDDNDIAVIKKLLEKDSNRFIAAWKVCNLKTQKRFDEYMAKEQITQHKLLWHGSRNENWWSIINSGLLLKPTNAVITGKMFGHGIYYAPKAQKSIGYTSIRGAYWTKGGSDRAFMAVMDVGYGKPYDVYSFENRFSTLNYERLQQFCAGANCLHGHAGSMLHNDEIVIYNESQNTIKYLVEIN